MHVEPSPVGGPPVSYRSMSYTQILRCLGQAVEQLQLGDFEIELDGADFVLRGEAARSASGTKSPAGRSSQTERRTVDIKCTPEVIERLEREGRARREDPDGMPEPLSPSQVLRAIGDQLDIRQATPRLIRRQGPIVSVTFDTPYESVLQDEHLVSNLFGVSMRMHLRRRNRDRGAGGELVLRVLSPDAGA